jgi:diazepam-binding inhibitor (GABA receptor modulating acyl-CoA-binding protein)
MEKNFEAAVEFVRNLPKGKSPLSTEQQLEFYALFKRATVGKCSEVGGSQPWKVNFEARAKWDAWNGVNHVSDDEAKSKYVALLDQLNANWFDEHKNAKK